MALVNFILCLHCGRRAARKSLHGNQRLESFIFIPAFIFLVFYCYYSHLFILLLGFGVSRGYRWCRLARYLGCRRAGCRVCRLARCWGCRHARCRGCRRTRCRRASCPESVERMRESSQHWLEKKNGHLQHTHTDCAGCGSVIKMHSCGTPFSTGNPKDDNPLILPPPLLLPLPTPSPPISPEESLSWESS